MLGSLSVGGLLSSPAVGVASRDGAGVGLLSPLAFGVVALDGAGVGGLLSALAFGVGSRSTGPASAACSRRLAFGVASLDGAFSDSCALPSVVEGLSGGPGSSSALASSRPCLISAPNQEPGPFRGRSAPSFSVGPLGAAGRGAPGRGLGWAGAWPARHARSVTTAIAPRCWQRMHPKSYRSGRGVGSAGGADPRRLGYGIRSKEAIPARGCGCGARPARTQEEPRSWRRTISARKP